MIDLKQFKFASNNKSKENKKFLSSLKNANPRKLDNAFHTLHEEVFEEVDCLNCANCCKTTSPIFRNKDIERLAMHFRIKPGEL
ncbi:MAG: hypothetical protein RLO81_18715 [Fulvivirga sp.]|uniref:YkgJ family cysteine cluster protein n=1 Tax=Fulvivirga sp. TaxID=1931237 RepID=UPI0032ED6CD7